MTELRSWVRENQTLVYFLIAQALAFGAGGVSVISYMTNLEARVTTLEVRGSPHLADINTRLTVLEGQTKDNKEAIDRVVEVMTKKLNVNP
jgi:hypothetical protein